MTGREIAFGRDPKVTGPGAARVGPMRSTMNLAKRVHDVRERIALPIEQAAFELATALHHSGKHRVQALSVQFPGSVEGAEKRRETDGMKAERDELIQGAKQRQVL